VDEFHPDAERSLAFLHVLENLDPTSLKGSKHMTVEDNQKKAAFVRTLARRIESIDSRCNFYEIYRNKDLFTEPEFYKRIALSLAKTPNIDLPTEFLPYA